MDSEAWSEKGGKIETQVIPSSSDHLKTGVDFKMTPSWDKDIFNQ